MQLKSNLPVINTRHSAIPMQDKNARFQLVVMIKYTFEIGEDGGVLPAEKPAEIDLVDTYAGEDAALASILRPSQLFDTKPGTDVILLGHAQPPAGARASSVDVRLRVGDAIDKTVRAHGLRVWQRGGRYGIRPGPALPMREPVPLIYELAWGGMDLDDPADPVGEPRNYVGRGISRNPKSLVDTPAAQLEDPRQPIDGSTNVPAAFNPIHRHWLPRRNYAGTYDERWVDDRLPLLPEDFDTMFHVSVPSDQWSQVPLRSDVPVEVYGVSKTGVWRFSLPRISPGISSFVGWRREEHRTHLDTMLIDADNGQVELTWRAAIRLPAKLEQLDKVHIFEKSVVG